MKIKFINSLFVSLLLTISSVANAGLMQFEAESAGFDLGKSSHLSIDGDSIVNPGSRGVNIAVFDLSGTLQGTSVFDTHISSSASSELANYINSIAAGSIVLLAVNDEATWNFTDVARLAIQTLGGSTENIAGLDYRSSYALIGIAGSGVGTRSAFEMSSSEGSVSVTDSINVSSVVTPKPIPEPSTIAIFALGLFGLVARRFKK